MLYAPLIEKLGKYNILEEGRGGGGEGREETEGKEEEIERRKRGGNNRQRDREGEDGEKKRLNTVENFLFEKLTNKF